MMVKIGKPRLYILVQNDLLKCEIETSAIFFKVQIQQQWSC
jgi:hypothetical protein